MPSATNSSFGKFPSSNEKQSTSPETSSTASNNTSKSVAKLTENISSLSLQQDSCTTVVELKWSIVKATLQQLIQEDKNQISQLISYLGRLQKRVSHCTISRANCEIDYECQFEKERNSLKVVVKEMEKMESFKRRMKNFEKVEEELVRHVKNIQSERLKTANNRVKVLNDLLLKIKARKLI